jgi:4-hydroxy-3-methylbut-2-enyl diphosphate reductase
VRRRRPIQLEAGAVSIDPAGDPLSIWSDHDIFGLRRESKMRNTVGAFMQEAMEGAKARQPLLLLLASPRGFCAGVDRAIEMLNLTLRRFGPPIYARHAIVHNPIVVGEFEARGVVFVDDLSEIPRGAFVVISAHGVSREVMAQAAARELHVIDTTCPLVSKIHAEVRHHIAAGRKILLIGHPGHPEVLGTMGQAPEDAMQLVPDPETAARIPLDPEGSYGVAMQTTLSVRDASATEAVLRKRLPGLIGPARDDICYATTNRQSAVSKLAPRCDAFVVIGGRQSSNSLRLADTARSAGCARVGMIERAEELDLEWLSNARTLGVSAGASTPESSVKALCDRLGAVRALTVEEDGAKGEDVHFGLPAMFEQMLAETPRGPRA